MNRRTVLAIPAALAAQLMAQSGRSKNKTTETSKKQLSRAEVADAKQFILTSRVSAKSLPPDKQALYERHLLGLMILCFDKTKLAKVYSTDYAHLDPADALHKAEQAVYDYLHAKLVADSNFYKAFTTTLTYSPFGPVAALFAKTSADLTNLVYDPDNPCPSGATGLWLIG